MSIGHVKSVTVADFTGTVTAFNSQGSTTTIAASDLARPSDWNSVHNQLYTLTGNTTLGSTASGTNVIYAGSGNVSVGGSSGSVIISGGPNKVSSYANIYNRATYTTTAYTASAFGVIPFFLEDALTADYFRILVSVAIGSTSLASTANTTFSQNQQITWNCLIYSQGTGASSTLATSVTSWSASMAQSRNVAYGSASNTQQSHVFGMTFPVSSGGTSTFSASYSTSNLSTIAVSTANVSLLSGGRLLDMPVEITLAPGEYFLMHRGSTAQTTQGVAGVSGARLQISTLGQPSIGAPVAQFGKTSGSSNIPQLGLGSWSTAAGATADSFALSAVSSAASHVIPYFSFLRTTG